MMTFQEHEIREAMAADVAEVVAAPDLADRVRMRYRRHRQLRATGALAVLTVLAVAAPVVTTEVRQALSPADRPAVDEVDGAELTYLPDGLRRDPVDGFDSLVNSQAVTGRWYPEAMTGPERYQHGVRVTVFRGTSVDFSVDRRILLQLTGKITPPLKPVDQVGGRVYFRSLSMPHEAAWTDVLWPAGHDVTLRVRVSEEFAGELERIVGGLRVAGPGRHIVPDPGREPPPAAGGLCAPATSFELAAGREPVTDQWSRFGGVVLHHVPAGLDGPFLSASPASGLDDDPITSRTWELSYRWGRWEDMPETVDVNVTCAPDPEVQAMLRDNVLQARGPIWEPYTLPGDRAGFIARDVDWTEVLWWEPSGAMLWLRVHRTYAEELDEILAGIEIVDP